MAALQCCATLTIQLVQKIGHATQGSLVSEEIYGPLLFRLLRLVAFTANKGDNIREVM
jgi:hypothetical protein